MRKPVPVEVGSQPPLAHTARPLGRVRAGVAQQPPVSLGWLPSIL